MASLAPVAYAQERPRSWSIPSLHTWRERSPNLEGVGFTEFTISTDAFSGKGVYGVEVGLAVDGQPVREDGMTPDQRPEPYSGQGQFKYGFGLRSLDMRGQYAGCDRVELTLKPLIKGRATTPIKVSTDYAALRPLPEQTVRSAEGAAVTWSGVYRPPPKRAFENEVFLASISFPSVDDTVAMRRALDSATRLNTPFDNLGFKFQDRALVAVIRPPLTNPTYGIAVGAYSLPGAQDQFRFTYDYSTAKAVKTLVDASPAAVRLMGRTADLYSAGSNPQRLAKATPRGGCLAASA